MNTDQAIEDIKHYFNLDLMPHSRERLKRILELTSKEKIVEKVVTKRIYLNAVEEESKVVNFESLKEETQRIGMLYDTNLIEMQSKKRHRNIVSARAHVCRYMKLNSKITTTALGKFFRRDHTTIIHLLYAPDIPCAIAPLYKKKASWHTL